MQWGEDIKNYGVVFSRQASLRDSDGVQLNLKLTVSMLYIGQRTIGHLDETALTTDK